ncbi:hypothetical protein AB0F88_23550 [Streptosporangium sp. NPDC023963]|uniref:hypothetical protein n=1 Tax=Streptosporangium sp. NPDC023963 TaxID=3155608 RepID=UPI0034426E4F
MNSALAEIVVIVLIPAAAILLGVLYFLRVRMERPPVGVYTLGDVMIMMTAVLVIPVVYLALPSSAVATVLGLMTVFAIQITLAPLLPGRVALLVAFGAAALDLVLFLSGSSAATAWNNVLLLILVIGVCNLYVQSGIKARDVAVFALLLAGYDLVATTMLPTMGDFLRKVIDLPFAPVFAWWGGPQPMVIGLGDVLMFVLWTLVAFKAFGREAGWTATGVSLALAATLVLAMRTGLLTEPFPLMVPAGPLMALQYLFWRRVRGPERTTAAYQASRKAAASPVLQSPAGAAEARPPERLAEHTVAE